MIRTGIFLLTLLFPITLSAQGFEVIKATSLRTMASSSGSIIKRVQPGDKGDIISIEEWWAEVTLLNGQTGYIKTANIRLFERKKTPVKIVTPIIIRDTIFNTKPITQPKVEAPKVDSIAEVDKIKAQLKKTNAALENKNLELSTALLALAATQERLQLREKEILLAKQEKDSILLLFAKENEVKPEPEIVQPEPEQ